MRQRTIGDFTISAIGLGTMPMSVEGRPSPEQSIATIHAALDAGVTLLDTADAYHLAGHNEAGHGEELIARALRQYGGDTSSVLVATKGGHLRPERGTWALDGHPDYLKEAAKASAKRLGVDAIDLYQFHRPDPLVPFGDSVGALAELLDEGVIRMAGVSNTNSEQIRQANAILNGRLASVQNQYSPQFVSSADEIMVCEAMSIAFLPWRPLGGISATSARGEAYDIFREIAVSHDESPQVIALAWELAKSKCVIPIPGASRPESIRDSVRASVVDLTTEELDRLDRALGIKVS
ncbi:aldo/keto reductase [Rhodococcus sp. T2V]|uniref:aldo/keto reductase n=1 Tax=Rhodococcus sp. T2V TaxID=3034164 RepID=UPI0023E21653|nr:aldo/keto reductase [Rhodococcus sp. T2V]MDF3311226.1 aldo/keto reductase [Rhodococcus sp. T2V]